MKRTAILAAWLLSVVLAYQLGRTIDTAPAPVPPGRLPATEAYVAADEPETVQAPSALALAQRLSDDGQLEAAMGILEEYLTEAFDAEALFLLSELRQMTGDLDGALEPLIEVLRYPPSPDDADKARRRLETLVNAREQQLINAGDIAGLVAYFQRLVDAEPAYDGHRLSLVRWLARDGRLDEASRLLKEVGHVGVTSAQIAAVEREIGLARSALPVERSGGALYASARLRGARRATERRFLIDTGATMTGIEVGVLESIGATRVAAETPVHTANGVAVLPVYRIRALEIGPLVIEDMVVLGLTGLPGGAEGLLGMDVLDHLPAAPVPAVGRP